jgi:hypothetical protein
MAGIACEGLETHYCQLVKKFSAQRTSWVLIIGFLGSVGRMINSKWLVVTNQLTVAHATDVAATVGDWPQTYDW